MPAAEGPEPADAKYIDLRPDLERREDELYVARMHGIVVVDEANVLANRMADERITLGAGRGFTVITGEEDLDLAE